jgi:hypothetical protein
MVAIEVGQLVQDFTIIMVIASVMALISYKLKQPMVKLGWKVADTLGSFSSSDNNKKIWQRQFGLSSTFFKRKRQQKEE